MNIYNQDDLDAINGLGFTLLRFGLSGPYCELLPDDEFSIRMSTNVGRKPTNDGFWQWGKGLFKSYRSFDIN